MARGGKRLGPLAEWEAGKKAAELQSHMDVITPEQRAKGTYDKGRRIVNRGGDPVDRWTWAGRLSDSQRLAIGVCVRLWEKAGLKQRITQRYEGRTATAATEWVEQRANDEIDARKRLAGISKGIPKGYWDIFENVCRHGEPAGVAGSRLGYGPRSAQDRAHTIVCFVADIIALRERL